MSFLDAYVSIVVLGVVLVLAAAAETVIALWRRLRKWEGGGP